MNLLEEFRKNIVPQLMKELGVDNPMQVPRIEKVVINVTDGEAVKDPKILDVIAQDLALITGQKPRLIRARKSVAAFHLRKGMPIALKVTLRGKRAYDFIVRLVHFALPRVRDFRGIPLDGFDGRGNYNFGISEHTVFPEIDIDKVKRVFGMDINITTTAKTDREALALLRALGFPFERR